MKRGTKNLWSHTLRSFVALTLVAAVGAPTVIRASDGSDRDDRDGRHDDRDGDESRDIRHVVVIFQENVSFDHYFATYPNATGVDGTPFAPKAGTPVVNGLFKNGLLTTNPNAALPFRLSKAEAVTCDQDHNYNDEQMAFNGRAMNKFVERVGVGGTCGGIAYLPSLVMGYYDGNVVTAMWHYAQNFAMSDNSYGTKFGPSTPGALNLVAGQTWGATIAPDIYGKSGSAAAGNGNVAGPSGQPSLYTAVGDPRPGPALDNCTLPSNPAPGTPRTYITMAGRNVGDLLNEREITWGWFQGGFRPAPIGNSGLTNVPGATTQVTGAAGATGPILCGSAHTGLAGVSFDYIPHHEPFQYFPQTANPKHLPPSHAAMIGRTDQAHHQYDLSDFWTALDGGNLPAVSYLKAAAYQDGHPGYSDPLDEQTFVVSTINRLMESPEWAHMAIIIAYDDSDGWYDHEAGPVAGQSDSPQNDFLFPLTLDSTGKPITGNCGGPLPIPGQTFEGRCGLGPRLPLVVISPWARQNFVDHSVTDQSSILRFIEDNWDLGRLGNESTDATAGSLMPMFDFDEHHSRAPKLILDETTGAP
jgi:phospholipase C